MMRIEPRLLIRQQETLLIQLFGKVFFFLSHFKLGAFKSLMSLLETLENVS